MNIKNVEYSNREIARRLKLREETIHYRIKREQSGREEGRKRKPSDLDRSRAVIAKWVADYEDSWRRPALKTLSGWLRRDHGYKHSYGAFRRYVRKHFP